MQNRLKFLRETFGLSLGDLSKAVDIPKTSLSNYERGERSPRIEIWEKLADYFNVPVTYLMGLSTEKSKSRYIKVDKDDISEQHRQSIENINEFVSQLLTENNGWYASQVNELTDNLNQLFWFSRFNDGDYSSIIILTSISEVLKNINYTDFFKDNDGAKLSQSEITNKYLETSLEINKQLNQFFIKKLDSL